MPVILNKAIFDTPIIKVYPISHAEVGVITAKHEVYIYDIQNNHSKKVLHLNIPETTKAYFDYDPYHDHLLFGTEISDTLHLIDLNNKTMLNRFELDQQYPDVLSFSPDGLYIVCGTNHGRVLLWRYDSNTLIARLNSFPEYTTFYTKPKTNYVSGLAFTENMIASTGYGGSVVITDYRTQDSLKRLHPSRIKNTALLFYHNFLFIGNQSGTIFKSDRHGKSPSQRLTTSLGEITQLLLCGPEPYLIAVSNRPYITLINADTFKIIQKSYIEVDSPIVSVCMTPNHQLSVATQKGELHIFNLEPLDDLQYFIDTKAYEKGYRYCEQEPLLYESHLFHQLESIYQEHFARAKEALENNHLDNAKKLLDPFKTIKSKEIAQLFMSFSFMPRFREMFEHQKLSAFYGLAQQYPLLQSTALYEKAESIWNAHFTKAQKYMLFHKSQEAKEELKPFMNVTSKLPLIVLLIQHSDVMQLYAKSLHDCNYRELKKLIQRYPILREFPSYIQLMQKTQNDIEAITKALKSKKFEYAELLLHELQKSSDYVQEYNELQKFNSHAINLEHAIKNELWRSAYRLIDSHPELLILPWAEELNTKWNEKLYHAENYAIHGNISMIIKEFNGLMNLPARHERIGDLFRTAYQIQLKKLLKTNPETFSSGIVNYCNIFGMDTEISALLKKAKRNNIVPTLEPALTVPKKRDQWLAHVTELHKSIV